MSELKITIDHIKNYLGTGLKLTFDNDELDHDFVGLDLSFNGVAIISQYGDFGRSEIKWVRPIVYRLSDLDKEIEVNGERFVPIQKLNQLFSYEECRLVNYSNSGLGWSIDPGFANTAISWEDMYPIIQKLFEWHFWPFGDEYFEQGLVIDKMTVK